jgi:hypothetical protein
MYCTDNVWNSLGCGGDNSHLSHRINRTDDNTGLGGMQGAREMRVGTSLRIMSRVQAAFITTPEPRTLCGGRIPGLVPGPT